MNPNIPSPYQQPQPPAPTATVQTGMFNGRLNRVGYLLSYVYTLVYFLIPVGLQLAIKGNMVVNVVVILLGIVGVALVIPISVSAGIRRWHDLNRSGWLTLLELIPFAGLVLLVIYLFVPGTEGANNYGAVDNRPSTLGKVLFGK